LDFWFENKPSGNLGSDGKTADPITSAASAKITGYVMFLNGTDYVCVYSDGAVKIF
jgi:hypothetical protein